MSPSGQERRRPERGHARRFEGEQPLGDLINRRGFLAGAHFFQGKCQAARPGILQPVSNAA
jgi:hypothetical protein